MKANWWVSALFLIVGVAIFSLSGQQTIEITKAKARATPTPGGYNEDIRKSSVIILAYRDAVSTIRQDWAEAVTFIKEHDPANDWVQEQEMTDFDAEVTYGDLTGDGGEEAIATISYRLGNASPVFSGVFVYTLRSAKPKLLARFEGGDRAHGAIESAQTTQDDDRNGPCQHSFAGACVGHGPLKVGRYRPTKADCNSCYGFIETTTYQWNGSKFVIAGVKTRRLEPGDAHFQSQRDGD